MKFIVDAQLPLVFKTWLQNRGHDALHTRDLPKKNLSEDLEIIQVAEEEDRIVISKDSDFLKYHILSGQPDRLLMITTGNIINRELLDLLGRNFKTIEKAFEDGSKVVELSNTDIIIHE